MIPLLLFLLGCAAVYVGTIQAAFSALMRLSLRLRAERADTSEILEHFLEHPLRLFVPARIVLGLVIVIAADLVGHLIGPGTAHTFGLTIVATMGFVFLCEHLVPSLIVGDRPQRILEALLPSFRVLASVVAPITRLLERRAAEAERPAPEHAPEEGNGGTEAPAAEAAAHALSEGEGRRLLRSIVDFADRLVREVMTPRPDIAAIPAEATFDELRAFYRDQEYSRIPVYRGSLDNIVGMVFVKDLIKRHDEPGTTPITTLVRPAYFVPETKRVAELLKEFQRNQVQSAIVVDEYGGTAGLVSLEDLIEEIVGEIRDEYDVETEPIVEEGEGAFLVSGKADIDAVAERLGLDVEPEGFETFGGYLLARLGRVPAVGETLEVDGLAIEVLEAERRRIHKVRVRIPRPAPVSDAPNG